MGIDREQPGIRARQAVGQRRPGILIGRVRGLHRRAVLGDGHRRRTGKYRRLVDVGDGDAGRLRGRVRPVAGAHDHVIDVVAVRVGRRLEVRRGPERDHAGRAVDREQRRVAAGEAVAQRRARIRIGRVRGADRRAVLRHGIARDRGDDGRFIDVGDVDGQRPCRGVGAVGDLHGHLIGVVAVGVGRVLVIGRGPERQRAGRRVDLEQARIGTARDRPAQRRARVGVARRQRRNRRAVLRDGIGRARRDHRRLVDVADIEGQRLRLRQPVRVGHRQREAARRRCLVIEAYPVLQPHAAAVHRKQVRVRAAQRVGQRVARIRVARREGRHRRGDRILHHRPDTRQTKRRRLVHVRHRHREVLRRHVRTVGHRDRQVIDVVGAGVLRGLEIRGGLERQRARIGVDREQVGVRAPGDRPVQGRSRIGVGRGQRADGRAVLRPREAGRRGDGRCLVDVGDVDRDRLDMGRAVGGGRRHLDGARRAGFVVERRAVREQDLVARHDEGRRIRAASDRIGRGRAVHDGERRGDRAADAVLRDRAAGIDRQPVDEMRGGQRAVVELELLDIGDRVVAVGARDRIGLGRAVIADAIGSTRTGIQRRVGARAAVDHIIAGATADDVVAAGSRAGDNTLTRNQDIVDAPTFVGDGFVEVAAKSQGQGRPRRGQGDDEMQFLVGYAGIARTDAVIILALREGGRVRHAACGRYRVIGHRRRASIAERLLDREDRVPVYIDLDALICIDAVEKRDVEADRRGGR